MIVHEDDSKALRDHSENNRFRKRAADDGAADDTTPAPSKKKPKKKGGKGTDAPSGSSTTTTGTPSNASTTTTTGAPGKSIKKSTTTTTTSPDDNETGKPEEDSDEWFMNKLVKDQAAERTLLLKLNQALKDWIGWLEAHDKKTLNKKRAHSLFMAVSGVNRKYFARTHRLDRPDRGPVSVSQYARPYRTGMDM